MRKTLEELLEIKECEYLDFKYSIYKLFSSDNNLKILEIMELLRDVSLHATENNP